MKYILPILILLASCSKKDDVQPTAKTYITVTNNINYDLGNVVVGNSGKLILSVPSMKKGDVSTTIETSATLVNIYFDNAGKTYAILDPFVVKPGITNALVIGSGATVIETTKTSASYPK